MPDRLAKDVMVSITEYTVVKEEDTLRRALLVLKSSLGSGHRTLAVQGGRDEITGLLTLRAILKTLEALAHKEQALAGSGWKLPLMESWAQFFLRSKIERLPEMKVRHAMRPVSKIFVGEDAPLPEAVKKILQNQVNHVPVLNKEQKVVGVIRAVDVLGAAGDFLEPRNGKKMERKTGFEPATLALASLGRIIPSW